MDVAIVLISKSVQSESLNFGDEDGVSGLEFSRQKKKEVYFCKYLFQFWGETSLVDFWGLNFRAQKKVLT